MKLQRAPQELKSTIMTPVKGQMFCGLLPVRLIFDRFSRVLIPFLQFIFQNFAIESIVAFIFKKLIFLPFPAAAHDLLLIHGVMKFDRSIGKFEIEGFGYVDGQVTNKIKPGCADDLMR